MSYTAIIAPVLTRPHPNADKLNLGVVAGSQVVVGKDTENGALGIFFPADGQLSKMFADENDLIARFEEKDGKKVRLNSGYFDENRRVRAQSFRGEKSEGIWLPLSSLAFTGADLSLLRTGDTLTELNGWDICSRYETPATRRAMRQASKVGKPKSKVCLPEHEDTKQYRFFADSIPAGATVYLTEKVHGTSHRIGNVPTRHSVPAWKQRVLNVIDKILGIDRLNDFVESYGIHHGSRRVVLKPNDVGYYGTHGFRYNALPLDFDPAMLKANEVIYGEVVGYISEGQPIMQRQPVNAKELPDIHGRYGDTMEYSYGVPDGQARFYVYRITRIVDAAKGEQVDLPWPAVKQRAKELGLEVVPDLLGVAIIVEDDADRETVKMITENMMEGHSMLDLKHIREGVALRVETASGVSFYKAKSFSFGVLEGYIKSDDNYVDTEEVESAAV